LLEENAKFLPSDIEFLKSLVNYMHYIKEYDKSMPYIDKILVLYPYSFIAMELKGDVLLQADKKVEAMEWYQKSLLHNSGNSELRKKIRDISNEKDYIEDFITKDVYKFIESKKSKITTNNY
jgi:tetratricopeptide (TPR) repeat protein